MNPRNTLKKQQPTKAIMEVKVINPSVIPAITKLNTR